MNFVLCLFCRWRFFEQKLLWSFLHARGLIHFRTIYISGTRRLIFRPRRLLLSGLSELPCPFHCFSCSCHCHSCHPGGQQLTPILQSNRQIAGMYRSGDTLMILIGWSCGLDADKRPCCSLTRILHPNLVFHGLLETAVLELHCTNCRGHRHEDRTCHSRGPRWGGVVFSWRTTYIDSASTLRSKLSGKSIGQFWTSIIHKNETWKSRKTQRKVWNHGFPPLGMFIFAATIEIPSVLKLWMGVGLEHFFLGR